MPLSNIDAMLRDISREITRTPTPNPSPQGGGEHTECAERAALQNKPTTEEDKVRGKPEKFADHYTQATLFWNSQTPT